MKITRKVVDEAKSVLNYLTLSNEDDITRSRLKLKIEEWESELTRRGEQRDIRSFFGPRQQFRMQ